MFLPEPQMCRVRSSTSSLGVLRVTMSWLMGFPAYGMMHDTYWTLASLRILNKILYYPGFWGIYTLNRQRPQNLISVSSIVVYSNGVYIDLHCSLNLVNTSGMEGNWSSFLRCYLVSLSSNWITLSNVWKRLRNIVGRKIGRSNFSLHSCWIPNMHLEGAASQWCFDLLSGVVYKPLWLGCICSSFHFLAIQVYF